MKNKIIITFNLILVFLLLFSIKTLANTIKIETTKTTINGTEIKITSENKISQLVIYKQVGNDYIRFYVSSKKGYTERNIFIPKNKLSTTGNTNIKVKIVDENGETITQDQSLEKIPEMPAMNPEETATPSVSPIAIPTKPTPTAKSTQTQNTNQNNNPNNNNNNNNNNNSQADNPSNGGAAVTSVYLPTKTMTIEVGEQFQLTPIISPSYAKTTLKWISNNTKAATVDSKGIVKGVDKGSAIITVRAQNGLSSICVVTVKESTTKKTTNNNSNQSNNSNNNNNNNSNGKLDFSYKGNGKVKAQFSSPNMKIIENHLYDFNYNNFRQVIAKHGNFTNYTKTVGGIYADYYGHTVPVKTSYDVQMVAEYVWGWMYMYGFDYLNGSGQYWMWGNGTSHSDDSFYPGNMKYTSQTPRSDKIDTTISGSTKDLEMTVECGLTVDYVYTKIGIDRNQMVKSNKAKYIGKLRDLQPGDKINFFNSPVKKVPTDCNDRWANWKNGTHVAMVGEVYDDKIVIYDGGSHYMRNRNFKRTIKRPKNDSEETNSVLGYGGWSAERFITLSK